MTRGPQFRCRSCGKRPATRLRRRLLSEQTKPKRKGMGGRGDDRQK